MEFENLSREQLQRIDNAVANLDWSPERQRLLVGRAAETGVPRSQSEVLTRALDTRLYEFAAGVVPGLLDREDGEKPTFTGHGASCQEVGK
ncbi:hypothetical protein [Actinopolymorpha pittospori]|uniref:Uncharacterized protein n=1 Tax=Actinopolymorpha pittospori TaxID=648752 RepID=A0A927MRV5_9ACTN|nr:hypothetical protein [Actinopolymorpha pittospori]MBE1605750.1 hypothetical protein [Actinopolymorpha pittospori]